MDKDTPQAAFLEIIERRRGKPDGTLGDDIVVPTEVRLNGQLLAMPAGSPVRVHEIEVSGEDCVVATLTLLVKRLVIGAEWPGMDAAEKRGKDAHRRLSNLGLIGEAAEQSAGVA
jgi:hypothetical protein